jgi:hypothetical protein
MRSGVILISKLFFGLAWATGEENTKFGIFLRWLGTFSGLIEFPRDVTA